jgi:hypothetical protein
LTEADYAWAARLGISRRRADWLASCPKNTGWSKHRTHNPRPYNPNHNLQFAGDCVYFRMRRNGVDVIEKLEGDLEACRKQRDALVAKYSTPKKPL